MRNRFPDCSNNDNINVDIKHCVSYKCTFIGIHNPTSIIWLLLNLNNIQRKSREADNIVKLNIVLLYICTIIRMLLISFKHSVNTHIHYDILK